MNLANLARILRAERDAADRDAAAGHTAIVTGTQASSDVARIRAAAATTSIPGAR